MLSLWEFFWGWKTAVVQSGVYSLTGENVTLDAGLPAGAGIYSLTGEAVTLDTGLPAAFGSYTLTGEAVTLGAGLTAAFGSYALTGEAVTLGSGLSVGFGSYALTGEAATLGPALTAAFGSYLLTGESITVADLLAAGVGAYTLTGESAVLSANIHTVSIIVTDTTKLTLPVNCVLGDGTNEPEKFKTEIDRHPPNVRGIVKLTKAAGGRLSGGKPSFTVKTGRGYD